MVHNERGPAMFALLGLVTSLSMNFIPVRMCKITKEQTTNVGKGLGQGGALSHCW